MTSLRSESDTKLEVLDLRLVRGERTQTRMRVHELADGSWVEIPVVCSRVQARPRFLSRRRFHGEKSTGLSSSIAFPVQLTCVRCEAPSSSSGPETDWHFKFNTVIRFRPFSEVADGYEPRRSLALFSR